MDFCQLLHQKTLFILTPVQSAPSQPHITSIRSGRSLPPLRELSGGLLSKAVSLPILCHYLSPELDPIWRCVPVFSWSISRLQSNCCHALQFLDILFTTHICHSQLLMLLRRKAYQWPCVFLKAGFYSALQLLMSHLQTNRQHQTLSFRSKPER